MNSIGISPRGYTAPFGEWTPSISQAIRDNYFLYSSEFSYDYDNLPSRVYTYSSVYDLLQIPVHPICIGSLRRQGFTSEMMIEYFLTLIDNKYKTQEPISLYHHPIHENWEVVEEIFKKIKALNIPTMAMGDYAGWWNKRNLSRINRESCEDVCVRVINTELKEKFIPVENKEQIDINNWKYNKIDISIPNDILKIKKFNKWIYINKLENYLFTKK